MESKTHNLKTKSVYFQRQLEGVKNFELRYNDRDFQVGDELVLEEAEGPANTPTGRRLSLRITYILHQYRDIMTPGWVILGTERTNQREDK